MKAVKIRVETFEQAVLLQAHRGTNVNIPLPLSDVMAANLLTGRRSESC
ncbi:hypothetical protein [Psychromonas ingrahamii]|nr:hypothetical protein [Psychromonas ingrahamii]